MKKAGKAGSNRAGWKRALARVGDHREVTAEGGAVYLLNEIVDTQRSRRLVYERNESGSTFGVTGSTLDRCWAATADGGRLTKRQNGPHGISYTVAIEACVAALLGLVRDKAGNWRRP